MTTEDTKTLKLKRPYVAYAHKLEEFLKYKNYDKETCILLGVIAAQSVRKHTALHDEICTAIASLHMHDSYADCLVSECKFNFFTGLKF